MSNTPPDSVRALPSEPVSASARVAAASRAFRSPGLWPLLALVLAAQAPPSSAAEIRLTDARGQAVVLPRPAQRIVALAPQLTENLYAIGAGGQVVGTVQGADFPDEARRIPRIGTRPNVNITALRALQPDLILAWQSGNGTGTLTQLAALESPLYVCEPRQMADIPGLLRDLGRLSGHEAAAGAVAGRFQAGLRAMRRRHAGGQPVAVYYESWRDPAQTRLSLPLVDSLLALCGGRNVFAAETPPDGADRIRAVSARRPEVILSSGDPAAREAFLDTWHAWPRIPAVALGHLYLLEPAFLWRPTPRLLLGARDICGQLEVVRQERAARR